MEELSLRADAPTSQRLRFRSFQASCRSCSGPLPSGEPDTLSQNCFCDAATATAFAGLQRSAAHANGANGRNQQIRPHSLNVKPIQPTWAPVVRLAVELSWQPDGDCPRWMRCRHRNRSLQCQVDRVLSHVSKKPKTGSTVGSPAQTRKVKPLIGPSAARSFGSLSSGAGLARAQGLQPPPPPPYEQSSQTTSTTLFLRQVLICKRMRRSWLLDPYLYRIPQCITDYVATYRTDRTRP